MGGKLKLLAITSPRRSPLMPEVPTMQEAGVPGYEMSAWFGLLAPAKTPQDIIDRLYREVKKAAINPKFIEAVAPQAEPQTRLMIRPRDSALRSRWAPRWPESR